ncbi:hypothetical protein [Nocardioides acrostichi]|uniref:Uncharacterized protein n=1 Tax=Nocardioides acrostichi TaxID=2784339 RepID=A0A930V1U7_9ACTN|nr:hypothetical protein [Nocardioides acrostichi]MBF4163120.1 hypothetical protein [Nocardioides acrostichi]
MSYRQLWSEAPLLIKVLVPVVLAAWVVLALSLVLAPSPWLMVWFPATLALYGLTMALDLQGSARAMSAALKRARPMGVDYSGSFISSVWYARVVGAGVAAVAVVMAVMMFVDPPG